MLSPLLVWFCGLAAEPLPACTCVPGTPPQSVAAMRDKLDTVAGAFTGQVIDVRMAADTVITDAGRLWITPVFVATVAIAQRWKGGAADTLQVETPANITMCGAELHPREQYLFFAYGTADGYLGVSKCDPPRPLHEATQEIRLLRQLGETP